MTARIRRTAPRRRRRESKRPLVVALQAGLLFAILGLFAITMIRAPREIPILPYKTVYASLPETGNLRVHAEVRTNGVRVGEVIQVDAARAGARARLKLDPGVLDDLPVDTTASVRGKGLLGARSVLLETGTAEQRLEEGATIPPGKNPITLSVTDALDTFDRETRGGLATTVGELGRGLLGRSRELNDAIGAAPDAAADFNPLVDAVLARPGAAERLLPSLDSGMAALRRGVDDIADGVDEGDLALRPFVDRRPAVQDLLAEAPPTLAIAEPALGESRRLVRNVGDLARSVNRSLPGAEAGLRSTTRLLVRGRDPLQRAGALVDEVVPTVPAALKAIGALRPLLEPTGRLLRDALPTVEELGLHGCDIVDFGDNWSSTLNQATEGGGLIGPLTTFRVTVMAAPESLSGFGKLDQTGKDTDGYPAPCKYSVPPREYPVLTQAPRSDR